MYEVQLRDRTVHVVVRVNGKACRFQNAANLVGKVLAGHGAQTKDITRSELYWKKHAEEDWQRALLARLRRIDTKQYFTFAQVLLPSLQCYVVGGGSTQKTRQRAANLAIAFAGWKASGALSTHSPGLQELVSYLPLAVNSLVL